MNYMNTNFDITMIECFNNLDGLQEISNYLDFALHTTIRKQLPNISEEDEVKYANVILQRYLNGDKNSFTSNYNIRGNMEKVGTDKLRFLLYKSLIERNAYNERVLHMLSPTEYIDQCCAYVSSETAKGNLDKLQDWLKQNETYFIESYSEFSYKKSNEIKQNSYAIALENPDCSKALEQLNLEMGLKSMKQK